MADAVTKKDRVFFGSAVKNGVVRFSSVSQISLFDPHAYGGCPRRWAYRYKWQMGKEESDQMKAGSDVYAKSLEEYLKTGIDKLVPVLRPAKHFFSKPGPDLEVEQRLGDMAAAVALREQALHNGGLTADKLLQIHRIAGLSAAGVPIDGAADWRHRRGEYIDGYGQLRAEAVGMVVAEIGDLKTISRIDDHVTRSGDRMKGYAKTVEEILAHTQMVGYGVHACDKWPDLTHVRLSHVYAQTRFGFAAAKRTGLLEVGEVRRRWEVGPVRVVKEMVDVAASATTPEQVPHNIESCNSYRRECPHAGYCSRPNRTIADMLQIRKPGEKKMGNGFFDVGGGAPAAGTNGAPVSTGFFSPPQLVSVPNNLPPAPPPLPQINAATRAAEIAAEKARLIAEEKASLNKVEGYSAGQGCNGNGYYVNANGHGFINVEAGHVCHDKCAKRAPQLVPHIGQVNPPDGPPRDILKEAAPLSAQVIAAIPDDEVRAAAKAHADAVEKERQQEEEEDKPNKGKGKCSGSKWTITLTPHQLKKRKIECPVCFKEMRLKDKDCNKDLTQCIVPGHRIQMDTLLASLPAFMAEQEAARAAKAAEPPPPLYYPPVPALPPPPPPAAAAPEKPIPLPPMPPLPPPFPPPPSPPVPAPAGLSTAVTASSYYTSCTLYLDVIFDKGEQPASLNAWCDDLVSTLEKRNGLDDIRLAPNTTDLGYGKWRAALAAMAKANIPPPQNYVITGHSTSELRQAIVEGLQSVFGTVLRGSGR